MMFILCVDFFFFFQAEDGIRDLIVTGVQTCVFRSEWVKAVLWGGAYVGEVIRRNAPREYNWVDFDEFIREYPDTTQLLGEEKQLGVCALLTPGGEIGRASCRERV